MTSGPYVKIWSLDKTCGYPIIKPGIVKRQFLDDTIKAHGYNCQPLTTANLHGWDFLLPQDVVVMWDGISDTTPDHVKILEGRNLPNGAILVDTRTANATITFNLNAMIETDPDHYSVIIGPPNYFINGAKPMTVVIRTDFYSHNPLQFCWVMTTPNKSVTFKAGTPFATLLNYPKNLIETTSVQVLPASEDKIRESHSYGAARKRASSGEITKFPGLYKKGIQITDSGEVRHLDTIYKPRPTNPIYDLDE